MNDFVIYLAGKCKGLTIEEQNTWRNSIKKQLESFDVSYRVKVINPNDYFDYYSDKHKSNAQVKKYYMSKIDKSDLIIVNLNDSDSSVGTAQEVQHAIDKNTPVIGFGTKNMYPWISEVDCQVVFETLEECVEYIKEYYLT